MWSKLDDELFWHPKVMRAGRELGKNGGAIALGFYTACILYANKYLTDGVLLRDVLVSWPHVEFPLKVAGALARAGLLDEIEGGFSVHDFDEYNPSAKVIRKRRKDDRLRKQRERAQGNGAAS